MFFLAENYRHPAFREGVKDFSGLALGIAAWGLMTGVTMMKSGMSLTESVLMGILVFAGSSQLAAIPLLVADAPMWIVLTTGFGERISPASYLQWGVSTLLTKPFSIHQLLATLAELTKS